MLVHDPRERVAHAMSASFQVNQKPAVGLLAIVRWGIMAGVCGILAITPLLGEDVQAAAPDAAAILRSVRAGQASMHQTFQGKLRKGSRSVSYRMIMEGPMVRFEFPAAEGKEPQTVVIRFGSFDATLEVRDAGGKLLPVRFHEEVSEMGVSYEDLALRFLFWPGATLEGEERVMLSKCWRLRVKRPSGSTSGYEEVVVWVSQANGAFLKSEAYGENGVILRRLTVRSLQTIGDTTTLKQLRAESPNEGGEPSYLDVDGDRVAKAPK